MIRAARRLFGVNVLQLAAGLITGVLTARALGTKGRGELAAILAVLGTLPYVLVFGLTTFASRAVARRVDPALLVGTAGGAASVVGLLAIPFGLWLAGVVAAGRKDVHTWIQIGVVLMPLGLFGSVLVAIAMGLERWELFARQKALLVALPVPVYAVLFAAGELTVASAAAVTTFAGLFCIWPLAPIAREHWPPIWDFRLLREGASFGVRALPITVSQLLNHRLDQIIMAPLVAPSALGLYAVAVTVAGLTGLLSSAIATVMFPRAAQSATDSASARAVRLGLLTTVGTALPLAAVAPLLLPVLFGRAFAAAYPLVLVLLVAAVPLAGVSFFISIYAAQSRLGAAGLSEVVALIVTVGGLLLLVRPLGPMGAALVSLAAYTVNFAWLAAVVPRSLGGGPRQYIVPTRGDFDDLWNQLCQVATRCTNAVSRS